MFDRVAVCGLGVLGGSFAKGFRRAFPLSEIVGCDLDAAALDKARRDKIIDGFFRLTDVFPQCDLAVVALPVYGSIPVISSVLEQTSRGCTVVDLGSVKAPIVDGLKHSQGFERFVACHPMAGSEQSGYDYSREDLFCGASVIVTPHESNEPSDIAAVTDMWKMLGARVVSADPLEHDLIVARTSHLPHLISAALAAAVCRKGKGCAAFAGRGLSDMTRLAGGSPDLWTEICRMNAGNIRGALAEFRAVLDDLDAALEGGEKPIRAFLEKGVVSKKEIYGEEDSCRG
jgi:prephenate dehydrogenase